jgi:hypothetical protein
VVPPPPLEDTFTPEEIAAMSEQERQWAAREGGYIELTNVEKLIEQAEQPEEVWLWCLHCERFFQVKHLKIDFLGHRGECPFCGAAGLSVDIHHWDSFGTDNPRWPSGISELSYGMRSPGDTEPASARATC